MGRRDFDSDLDERPRPRRRRARKAPSSNLVVILAVVGVCLLLAAGAGIAGYFALRGKADVVLGGPGGSNRSDLELLAGRWEATFRDPAGRLVMRKIKEIDGTTETVTWYQTDGRVFQINRVEFRLETRGDTKTFRYFNGWILNGPGAGQPFPDGEYIYTLEGDVWMEYGPGGETIQWTRVR
jgi:hypothetical protein